MTEQLLRKKDVVVRLNLKILRRQRKEQSLQQKNLLPRKKMVRLQLKEEGGDLKREQLLLNPRPRRALARAGDDPRRRRRRSLQMRRRRTKTRMHKTRMMVMSEPSSDYVQRLSRLWCVPL